MDYQTLKPSTFNPEDQRPGCLDFLKCPSLRGDKRVEYEPPKSQCVGVLKDKSNSANE